MVLEGLAAVSAAAAVVQFVGYGYQVISKGNELYDSKTGSLKDNAFLEVVIKDFQILVDRIHESAAPASQATQEFRDEGLKLAGEMLNGLEKLKVKGPPGKWKSLRKALKAVHSKEKVDSWTKRLNILRDQYNTHVGVEILEKFELLELSLSDEFQQLDVQQQKRLQVFTNGLLDAFQQDKYFFQNSVIQQLDDIKDSNRSEHAVTRTQISKNHQETLERIKTEQQTSQTLSTKEAEDTRDHVSTQHTETRAELSMGNDKLQNVITRGQTQAAEHSEHQHTGTQRKIVDSIIDQNAATESSLKDDSRQKIDFLEAEQFRAQLENEANLCNEHALIRQQLHGVNNRGYADTTVIMRQSRAILEQAMALRHEQHQITDRGTNIDANRNSSSASSDLPLVDGKASMIEAYNRVLKHHSMEWNTSSSSELVTVKKQCESPSPTPSHGQEWYWSEKRKEWYCSEKRKEWYWSERGKIFRSSFEETIAASRLSRAEKSVLPKLALLWLLDPEIAPDSPKCNEAYHDDCAILLKIREMIEQASSLLVTGKPRTAEQAYRSAVGMSLGELGPRDDFTLNTRLLLCDFLMKQGRHEDAKLERVEIAEILEQKDRFYVVDILELISEAMVKSEMNLPDPDFRKFPIFILRSLETIFGPMERITRERMDALEDKKTASIPHPKSKVTILLEQLSYSNYYQQRHTHIRTSLVCTLAEWCQRGINVDRSTDMLENALQYLTDVQFLPDGLWLSALSYAGWLEYKRGNNDRAIDYLTECLQRQNDLSNDHWDSIVATHRRLGNIHWAMGDFTTALEHFRCLLVYEKAMYGHTHNFVRQHLQQLANICKSKERWVDEVEFLDDLLYVRLESDGAGEQKTLEVTFQLGVALRHCNRLDDATETLSSAEAGLRRQPNPDRRMIELIRVHKAAVLEDQGLYSEAEGIRRDVLEVFKNNDIPWEKTDLPYAVEELGCNLVAQNRLQEAVEVLEQALALLEPMVDYELSELSITLKHLVDALRKQGFADGSPRIQTLRSRARTYRRERVSEQSSNGGPIFCTRN